MVAAAILLTTLVAQGLPASPPPDTGLIVGRVVDSASGHPVAGAVVTLQGGAASGPRRQPRAMTNGSGYFVFRKLTKGSYSLGATRPGYVDGAYGRRRPGGMPATLALDEGERVNDVVIPVWRHAAISGTVSDEAGEPLVGVRVAAFERRITAGRYRLMPGPTATTDDRGVYRIAQLSPGDYAVAFVWREASVPLEIANMPIGGGNNDPRAQELTRARLEVSGTAGPGTSGSFQIGGSARAVSPNAPVPPQSDDDSAVYIYPTQFYPGVPSLARATILTLASGQERESVDFSLRPVKTARVSGTLIGPDGPVANTPLRLVADAGDMPPNMDASVTMTGAGGEFTLLGVLPGQYTVRVLRVPRAPASGVPSSSTMTQIQMGPTTMMTTMVGPSASGPAPVPDDPTLFAEAPVTVGNRDVNDLIVTVQRGARVTGRLEFDGTRERPAGLPLTRVPISLDRVEGVTTGATPFGGIPTGHADETGAFKTYGVAAGRYIVRVGGAPPGWMLKSVTFDGRDISESPVDLGAADLNGVVVTFTDHPTRLTGAVHTAEGNADADATVIVFPVDQNGWTDYGLNPRRVRRAHASRTGGFSFTGLPAGDYYVTAIHEDTTPQWEDPKVLDTLAGSASQVHLGDGDARTQDVKTVKGGRQ
jgi:uncharacterized protein (DUF2141 family)